MMTVDAYIERCPTAVQPLLRRIRTVIITNAPDAIESFSYGMPAYKLFGKPLCYFGAFTHHIGMYATPQAQQELSTELASYQQGKGSIRFPLDAPMPYELIARIVQVRVQQLERLQPDANVPLTRKGGLQ